MRRYARMLTNAEQREIVLADQLRRSARIIEEEILLGLEKPAEEKRLRHALVVKADARAMSAVTALTTRVNAPWSSMRTRCVGKALNEAGDDFEREYPLGTCTVRVIHADGTSEVRPVSSFRKGSRATRSTPPAPPVNETEVEHFGLVNNIGADFS
jgi:hypothetical protein